MMGSSERSNKPLVSMKGNFLSVPEGGLCFLDLDKGICKPF